MNAEQINDVKNSVENLDYIYQNITDEVNAMYGSLNEIVEEMKRAIAEYGAKINEHCNSGVLKVAA